MSGSRPVKQLCVLLLALLPAAAGAAENWTNRVVVSDRHALASLSCNWSKDGLAVQLASTNHAAIEFRLQPGSKPAVHLVPERLFPEKYTEAFQLWPVPAPATNVATLSLRRQSHAWTLYVADEPVARFPEPWTNGAVTIRHPVDAIPVANARDQYVQRTAAFRFDDSFMVAKTVTNQFPEAWERVSGDWHLHSITGGVSGSMAPRKLARQPTPERSPNFYSLEGRGVVLAGETFQHRYSFRAAVQHNGGTNGLVFLATESGACHGFTAFTDPETEHLVFQLWRGGVGSNAPQQVISTVATELLAGQWTLMEVRLFDDRVVCLADNIEIMRQRLPLPPGGRFGLIAQTELSTRFDDVSVASHEDYPFESSAELRFHTLRQNGAFRSTSGGPLTPPGGAPAPVALVTPDDPAPQEWIFGATDDGPHKLEICLQPRERENAACSLIAGWQDPSQPYYRFTWRQQSGRRSATLERVDATQVTQLDFTELGPAAGALRLTLDALRPNELRGLINGRLVVVDRPGAPIIGAGGLRIESRNRLRLSLPQYVSVTPVYTDRVEKNPAYINDPYMRHWAAPEGQWIIMRDGLTWLRSDIIGRAKLRLPVVSPSVLHLVIPEGETNGQCTVSVTTNILTVRTPASGTNAAFTVNLADLPEEKIENAGTQRLYTVNIEDDLLWISSDTSILGRCHLPPLARGRRARLEGFSLEQLRQTLVRRENVFDTLFNESLYNWILNGGTWEVVNRFQCEPTWSHMNGESTNSFAGLWSKFELSGDFCVELYAGMRMGWYDRPGDFNLTVHSRRNATCDGYSVTLAGWDPDYSQLYTRLFRNGEHVADSTAYTAPRTRDGSARRGYEPLVTLANRPVHGAWYGMRFRRVGDQLSYLFDNEPVLSWRDPAPLESGALGIWTYRNSMMVARVRIAAESVQPRPFRFWPVANTPPPARTPDLATRPDIRVNDRPAELLDPEIWQDADPVSQPMLRFSQDRAGHPEMCVTSLEGGGSFLVAPRLPLVAGSRILGWHFEVARHPQARFNFEFSAGPTSDKATNQLSSACNLYSFVLCGSADPRSARRIAGRLAQPPAASPPDAGNRDLVWTPVDIWLPSEAQNKDFFLRIDGFGNLQPGDIQQGLAGNPPDVWYVIRNFHEIYNGEPALKGPASTRPGLDAVARNISQQPPGRVNTLRLPAALDPREPVIAWAVRPEAEFGLVARLDPATPEALRVSSTLPWPSPLLPARLAFLDGQPAIGWMEGNDYLVLLPRGTPPQQETVTTIKLELADGRTFKQLVPLAALPANLPPVLLTCEMPDGGLETFEARTIDPKKHLGRSGFAFSCTDPLQGASIRFQNAGAPDARLDGRLLANYDPVVTPLLQFRYQADEMAHVSLQAGRCNMAFSEKTGVPAMPGATGILDNAWHTWLGMPILTSGSGLLRGGYLATPSELRIGSRSNPDQTGRYSAIALDDLACGPALGPKRPLTFRPNYSDRQGLAEVLYAIAAGPEPWAVRTGEARTNLQWVAITNLQWVVPGLDSLPEGIHHVLTKARSSRGTWSAVYDIPFLLDRQAPRASFAIRATPDRFNGTCLDLTLAGDYAPPLPNKLRLLFDNAPLDLTTDNGQFFYEASSLRFELDWPWLLRKSIGKFKDGDTLSFSLEGIADAAGNEAPALPIPIKLDFANDKQPPTLLPLLNTTNLLVWTPQFRSLQSFFTSAQQVTALDPLQEQGCYYMPFRCQGGDESFLLRSFTSKPWDPEAFPWLALSVRIDGDLTTNATPFALRLRPAGNLPDQAVKPKTGNAYSWNLPTNSSQPFIVGRMDWKPGQWVDFLVNVRDLLREMSQQTNACALRDVALVFPAKAQYALHVRGMAILAPWGPSDVLKFKAYDLSGVAGLSWQNNGKSARTGIRPARLALPPDDAQWLKLRLSDRAGNFSPVFMLPVPPNALPIPPNLPLEVDVEDF
ncbi:MAG: hypothetical protein WCR06_04005 [bacterium]